MEKEKVLAGMVAKARKLAAELYASGAKVGGVIRDLDAAAEKLALRAKVHARTEGPALKKV